MVSSAPGPPPRLDTKICVHAVEGPQFIPPKHTWGSPAGNRWAGLRNLRATLRDRFRHKFPLSVTESFPVWRE